jgi:invasion protein IalB
MKPHCSSLLLVAALASTVASAAETREFRDWALRCGEQAGCYLEQRVYVEGAGDAPLLHVLIQSDERRGGLVLMLRVPLGILLPPGVRLQVDSGSPTDHPLHHCRVEGCIALVRLDDALHVSLEKGHEARVTFQTIDGRSIGVPVSLLGITAGLSSLSMQSDPPRTPETLK